MAASLVFRLHDGAPELVREVLLERGWEEYDGEEQEEEDWNLYWRVSAFRHSEYLKLLPWQRLNHHPKSVGITRKDYLARNLRRMRATFGSSLYNFSPMAFILPNDYTRFIAEYTKQRLTRGLSGYWICKPVDLSRGRGIFIFCDIKDLIYDSPVIVQRYISNPLLISGYKFDLRIYVCVKSFHPLTVYMHQEGLVRFATEKYNLSTLDNLYAHLTNTSINKCGPFYTTNKERVGQGCKWTMSKFRYFLHSQDVNELLLWQKIKNIVTLTILTIAPSVPSSPNCVELFGFDILIDSTYKPWLLEVNYSPALTLDCQADVAVKKGLISDLIDLMNYRAIDRLRGRAYQRPKSSKQPCRNAHQASQVSVPVLSKFRELKSQGRSGSQSSQTQTLPLLKALWQHQASNISQSQSRQKALVSSCQRYLPPVDLSRIHAARGRIINTNTTTKTCTSQALNPILGSHSRITRAKVSRERHPSLASYLTDNRALNLSDVTNHDDTVTEREPSEEGDSAKPDISQEGLGSLRSKPAAGPWKLPNIHRLPLEGTRASHRVALPPLRVGDFILTFPFNEATLEASQHKLDVKLAVQELHKLTSQLASGPSRLDKNKLRRQEEEVKTDEGVRTCDSDEGFESLFWGPKEPPLLSQCLPHN
ncbi:putative tubulin polyglutamylase TTLL2 [Myripristis murdjan]|uniref:putative tubulin polyglutamylase TTLL2 n=1 Tax=Myripristis murdjan TaxID=586833 RepID=UPI001175D6E5|nr:probable tubulin polyglutamylase TTLL2 [Myripristis murdjan]